ncbi:MAG: hypothetical protein PHY48_02930 [Candidatus Cloacimonetes bacterium]|nr:hypothetical protein [Candidatus Cloacimonadota bacterium]
MKATKVIAIFVLTIWIYCLSAQNHMDIMLSIQGCYLHWLW